MKGLSFGSSWGQRTEKEAFALLTIRPNLGYDFYPVLKELAKRMHGRRF